MSVTGIVTRLDEHIKSKTGFWMAHRVRMISLTLVVGVFLSLFIAVPSDNSQVLASAAPMRLISIELAAGQPSFSVTVDSKRVSGRFPKGIFPVTIGTDLAFPMRAILESMGGTVRFEKAQNTVYFAVGSVTGAYDIGKKTLVDGIYATSIRRDLFRITGKTGTLYLTDAILKTLVSQAGGTLQVKTKSGVSTVTCQIPSTVEDALGVSHNAFPAKAGKMRVVTLAPSLCEDVFAIGQGDRIIATTTYSDFPEEAKKIPTVGGYTTPSLEKLLVLSPDLILVTDGTPLQVVERLRKMGRNVYADNPRTVDAIVASVRQIAVVLGVPDRGFEKALSMHEEIARVRAAAAKLPRKPSVYVEIWGSPLISAGKDTFVSDIIAVAGGINIGDEAGPPWPKLSEEFVISRNPDVMINASGMGVADITTRDGFSNLTAVKEGRVYDMNGDLIFRASPRIVQGLELIAGYLQDASQP